MLLDSEMHDLLNELLGTVARKLDPPCLYQVRSEHEPRALVAIPGLNRLDVV